MIDLINEYEFWKQHERFLKVPLVTESPHLATYNLSTLAKTDINSAYYDFLKVELDVIYQLYSYIQDINKLREAITNTIRQHNRVFLLGCGASGRLAVLIRRMFGLYHPNYDALIIAVNAAGDTSLIRSVEQFEDQKDFGVKQLLQLGYTKNDLVIGLSASGESPFILNAIEYVRNNSAVIPWLICNNPSNILILRNPNHIFNRLAINSLCLDVGPMALAGSTRLQATTAMLIVLGLAIQPTIDIKCELDGIFNYLKTYPFNLISPLTIVESNILKNKEYVLYQTNDSILGLSLLADITERSPTFNLIPFENLTALDKQGYSQFYLSIVNQADNKTAWYYLLGQNPICLNWPNFPQTSDEYFYGFDISTQSNRSKYLDNKQYKFNWFVKNDSLYITLCMQNIILPLTKNILLNSLIYKIALNMHSTLMFGRLDYFMGNLMISLKPSNFKLVDRAIRYSLFILNTQYNLQPSYKDVADIIFKELQYLKANESIVLKAVKKLI